MPSLSVSLATTVCANTSRLVPEPRTYLASGPASPTTSVSVGVPSDVSTSTRSPKVTATSIVSPCL